MKELAMEIIINFASNKSNNTEEDKEIVTNRIMEQK